MHGRTYPVILTAGDRGRARPVNGTNKALLELEGSAVFTHVLAALENSPSVDRIYLVGPKDKMSDALEKPDVPFKGRKPVKLFEQWDNLYLNVLNTYMAILKDRRGESERASSLGPVIVVPSDIPLLEAVELEEFVRNCDMEQYDYCLGLTSETVLKRYYPQKYRKGIRLMYFHMMEGSYRQNNLHLVNPLKILNRDYIQKIYDYRYQKEWGSIIKLFWEMYRTHEKTGKVLGQLILLHTCSLLYRIPKLALYKLPAKWLKKERIEQSVSNLLHTRFTTVETNFGGAALDIDNATHYTAIRENFGAWKRMQLEGAAFIDPMMFPAETEDETKAII